MIKQIAKYIVCRTSDVITNTKLDNAHSNIYRKTGKELNRCKNNGVFINGSNLYKKNRDKYVRNINQRHERFIDFIKSL